MRNIFREAWNSIAEPDPKRHPSIEVLEQQHGFVDEKASRASEAIHQDSNQASDYAAAFYGSDAGSGDLWKTGDEDYGTLLDKYPRSIWLYIAINTIASALAQVKFRVIDENRKGKPNEEAKGNAQGLGPLLGRPNPWMSDIDFKETIAMHLLLTGNCFIEKAEVDGRGRPKELYLLNPKNMKVIPDKKTFVGGYVYTVNRTAIRYRPEEIIHIKLPDPRGESHYGLSPLAAARRIIDLDWAAIDWNTSYFKNATWPSGIITVEDGLNEEEYKRAKRELKQNYEGRSKVGKVIILSGGMQWTTTTPNPKDLDFLNLRQYSRDEILALLKVPPSIVGVFKTEHSAGRSAGVREQAVQFWSQTVQPISQRIITKLNSDLVPVFASNFKIVADVSGIPALKETDDMQKTRAETAAILVERVGLSPNRTISLLYPGQDFVPWGNGPSPRYNSFVGENAGLDPNRPPIPEQEPAPNLPEEEEEPMEEEEMDDEQMA